MRDFTFHTPTEVIFGRDAELKTGQAAKKYGASRVLSYTEREVLSGAVYWTEYARPSKKRGFHISSSAVLSQILVLV